MGGPISLGRFLGVHVRVESSLFLLAAFVVFNGYQASGLSGVSYELTFVACLFLCIFLHELGHAAAARAFGIETRDITLSFFGGYARLSRAPTGWAEAAISAAGPAVNLAIAAFLYWWIRAVEHSAQSLRLFFDLAWANLLLGAFNLLPGYPLDGGSIARAALSRFMPRRRARLTVGYFGIAIGAGLVLLGFWGFRGVSYTMFVGLLLIFAAAVEIKSAKGTAPRD
ncbi:MAG: M50 family metallopeptidase [Alphaproteobacteria bacterium]